MLKKIYITVILFLLLYYPPVFHINVLPPLGVISWIYLIINYRCWNLYLHTKALLKNIFLLVAINIWTLVIIKINQESLSNMAGLVYWVIIIIPICLHITIMLNKNNYSIHDLLNLLLSVGLIQGLLAIITFISPSLKQILTLNLLQQGAISQDAYLYSYDRRFYGYANGLTFGMPVVQAFLSGIALYLSIYKGKKYIIYTVICFFSAAINARVSMVVIGVCIGVLIFFTPKKKRSVYLRYLVGGGMAVIFVFLGIMLISYYAPHTFEWIRSGILEILEFLHGDINDGYFSYITDIGHLQLPKGIKLIVGSGARTLGGNRYGISSDIGYINDIWLGGILYCIVIYSLMLYYLIKINKIKTSKDKNILTFIQYTLLFCAIFLNVKMYIVSLNGFSNLFLILIVYIVYGKDKTHKLTKN